MRSTSPVVTDLEQQRIRGGFQMIAGGWIWWLPLPWEWRIALSEVTPREF
ncbi:hypothetical protein QNA24_31640 [Rhodococcus qingshengii]|nr:hypothetical protein [Rhodococcus qingshengii]MDJ0490936.1 hypothetical protein [Rhodococcus qingshengii]